MDARILVIGIVVKDQERALDFYTKRVGFEKRREYTAPNGYRFVSVAPKGERLEISLAQLGAQDPGGFSKTWRPGSSPPVGLYVDDCGKTFAEMKARGVEFREAEPVENDWGISATFSDPDGNFFSITQRPSER